MNTRTPLRFAGRARQLGLVVVTATGLGIGVPTHSQTFDFRDLSPTWSNGDAADADRASGGRVNGLAADPNDNAVFYAASEWGGLYKSIDSGDTWNRLHGHNPNATWDVKVDPSNSQRVFATSLYDGRVTSLSGLNVSTDGGLTWVKPASATPPSGSCRDGGNARTEPSAFGISIDPDDNSDVYVGTNCGLAVSTNSGTDWSFLDPDPGLGADWVIDVVVHDGGIIDVCGYSGHMRSEDGGGSWSTPSADLPGGTCSIAASPHEEDVLFVTVGANIYESDDGGASWTNLGTPDSRRQGRIPFVRVNPKPDILGVQVFDLWYGDVRLYRGGCVSNTGAGSTRCPAAQTGDPDDTPPAGWSGPYTRSAGGHDDVGDIVFDTAVAEGGCPKVFSSDGGVYVNTDQGSDCQAPNWEQPSITPRALWLWALAGVDRPGDEVEEYLYFGNQDNGTFGATDGGSTSPGWNNNACCDGFDFSAEGQNALYTMCCGGGRANKAYLGNPGLTSTPEINTYPADGLLPGFIFPDVLDEFGPDSYVMITRDCQPPVDSDGDGDIDDDDVTPDGGCSGTNNGDGGIYVTSDITAGSISWTELGPGSEPPTGGGGACAVKAAVDGATPTFYVQTGRCDGLGQDALWRFDGTDPTGSWSTVNLPAPGVSIFDVDPTDPERLFVAAYNAFGNLDMMLSGDGGATWDPLPELDDLMDGGGTYKLESNFGPAGSTRFWGYPQPSLVAFDPEDENILVAGGRDSGVFLSTDGGEDWVLVSDPDSVSASPPHLPQPWFAYFDHEPADRVQIYIGTRGRGVWRVAFDRPPIADAGGPYTTDEGVDVVLDGSGSSDPAGGTLTYEWDFDDDGQYDDATGVSPTFDLVGQDGVYPVALKVTNGLGLSDTDETTVTVANVAPSISFTPADPEDEGAPLAVSGTISDPGWLDPLTATIDWGDGSSESLSGTLENVRPDATLTFTTSHCYGDNGTYTVEVCGSDDDTTTCLSQTVQIDNVAPSVAIAEGQVKVIDESDTVSVLALFSDPGWLDTYSSTVTWGYDTWSDPATVTITDPGSGCDDPDRGTAAASKQYGDNGVFVINVAVTDDDGGTGAAGFELTVNNLPPTAEIDETDAVDVCGSPFFVANVGDDVEFSGRSTDPGSDDLTLTWDWGDGPPSPDLANLYLLDDPNADPDPSPEVSPRDVTEDVSHVFTDACHYTVAFASADDDGGTASDTTEVLIAGNAELLRSAGYWHQVFRRQGKRFFTDDQLTCLLSFVGAPSSVFDEVTDASTWENAEDVLHPANGNGEVTVLFDRQLLALWLNVANGAIALDDMVDTDLDGEPDTELLQFLCDAEDARLDPATTDAELEHLKDVIESINTSDG